MQTTRCLKLAAVDFQENPQGTHIQAYRALVCICARFYLCSFLFVLRFCGKYAAIHVDSRTIRARTIIWYRVPQNNWKRVPCTWGSHPFCTHAFLQGPLPKSLGDASWSGPLGCYPMSAQYNYEAQATGHSFLFVLRDLVSNNCSGANCSGIDVYRCVFTAKTQNK